MRPGGGVERGSRLGLAGCGCAGGEVPGRCAAAALLRASTVRGLGALCIGPDVGAGLDALGARGWSGLDRHMARGRAAGCCAWHAAERGEALLARPRAAAGVGGSLRPLFSNLGGG